MNCKISRNAAKKLNEELTKEEFAGQYLRIYVTHAHGDHAHYGLAIDHKKDSDELVDTDSGIQVLLEQGNEFLDGVRVDYFYEPQEGFAVTNPGKGNHGDH